MNASIADLILASKGYSYETAGIIIGFFNDQEQALCCADNIAAMTGKTAEVCGNRLALSL